MARKMKTHKLPDTDSIEELARFWQDHDLTDFEEQLEEGMEPVFVRPGKTAIHLELSMEERARLEQIAHDMGLNSSELVHEWVVEKLQAA